MCPDLEKSSLKNMQSVHQLSMGFFLYFESFSSKNVLKTCCSQRPAIMSQNLWSRRRLEPLVCTFGPFPANKTVCLSSWGRMECAIFANIVLNHPSCLLHDNVWNLAVTCTDILEIWWREPRVKHITSEIILCPPFDCRARVKTRIFFDRRRAITAVWCGRYDVVGYFWIHTSCRSSFD